jgi:hypothetical protein
VPRVKLTKTAIDALPRPAKDSVHWDSGCPGFGVKITPKGRKVFIVLYRAGGAGSRLRKYTIGPYGRVTLHQARAAALKIFPARAEGRDPAAEKQQARRRLVADRVEDIVELFINEHVSKNRSAREISRLLRREVIPSWGRRSIHEIGKRQIIELITEVAALGTPSAANKILNHQGGTFSGVAAVYQRHVFISERKDALERWGAHVESVSKRPELRVA